ncbi:MAG: hypothetical protein NTY38_03520 [Acidobacteria bacterium]|nr:hypothetical protein [Acidobacteriota bacterium]
MAKTKASRADGPPHLIEVECPCCQASLKVDAATRSVISHKEKEKPKPIEDLAAAVARLKGEAGRRDDAFQKSLEQHKMQKHVLDRKFDELLKQAQADPDSPPPLRDFDFD